MNILNASQRKDNQGETLYSVRFIHDDQLMRTTPAHDRPDRVLISRVGIEQWDNNKGEGQWVRLADRSKVKHVRSILRAQFEHSSDDQEYYAASHFD